MSKPSDLIQGTLDLLILKTVALEPKHGWAIAKRIQQISGEVLQITQGSLYPALHRLEQQGWLKAQAGLTDTGREAKFYALTRRAKTARAGARELGSAVDGDWPRRPRGEVDSALNGSTLMQRMLDKVSTSARGPCFAGGSVDASLKGEIELHLQEQIDENIAAGDDRRTRRAPRRCAPSARQSSSRSSAATRGGSHSSSTLSQDLRYTLRSLVRQPMLLAAAVLSIGVAIGANTTIFSLASELMFAMPSATRPDRLVHIRMGGGSHVSHRQWRALDESGALAGLTGFNIETPSTGAGRTRP